MSNKSFWETSTQNEVKRGGEDYISVSSKQPNISLVNY